MKSADKKERSLKATNAVENDKVAQSGSQDEMRPRPPLHCGRMGTQTGEFNSSSRAQDQRIFWDQWHLRHTVASHTEHSLLAIRTFVRALGYTPGVSVLELGCGQGREAVSLVERGFRVSALDYSPIAIAAARDNARSAGVTITFLEHDATNPFPYHDSTFDGVFSHLSLHYFDDAKTRQVFDEIARVLAPEGTLFFTVRATSDPLYGQGESLGGNMFQLKGHVRHFFDEDYVKDVLASWNIKFVQVYDTKNQAINPGVFLRVLATKPRDMGE